MHKRKKKSSIQEYSKKVIATMILLWFIVAIFGIALTAYQAFISPEYANIDGLYNFVGYPMTGGIIGYLIKSAVENKQKIKSKQGPINEEPMDDNREVCPNG